MARVKVRHALVQYASKNSAGQDTFETAFRNMEVDIPDGPELDRLRQYDAVVYADAPLTRPGRMMVLPETAGDSEIVGWVTGATNEEVEMLVRERPVMAPRIKAAWSAVQERFAEQNLHLGGLEKIAEEATHPAVATGDAEVDEEDDEEYFTADDAEEIVQGNVKEVSDYVAENPEHASLILEAEGKREDGARQGVVRAAEAAAKHANQ